jgi:hypothetical protein
MANSSGWGGRRGMEISGLLYANCSANADNQAFDAAGLADIIDKVRKSLRNDNSPPPPQSESPTSARQSRLPAAPLAVATARLPRLPDCQTDQAPSRAPAERRQGLVAYMRAHEPNAAVQDASWEEAVEACLVEACWPVRAGC